MYNMRGNKHLATIGGKQIMVDSNLEETVLTWLEENGFRGKWRRLEKGFSVGKNNYTPDLELSVELEGKLHRALVEIKPNVEAFTDYVSRRMRGIAPHYHTQLMLLYADKEKSWYKIDIKSGDLTLIEAPSPGKRAINTIPGHITVPTRRIYNHKYVGKLNLLSVAAKAAADTIQTIVAGPKKSKKINKTARKRYRS
jgi:hypothetical protein